jgi:hypothetical protein
LRGTVVLDPPALLGARPEQPGDDAGRDRDERDERATDEHRRPDTVPHPDGDTTEPVRLSASGSDGQEQEVAADDLASSGSRRRT